MLRPWLILLLAAAGCGDGGGASPDAGRFEMRDAVIDPRPDSALNPDASSDASPTVDVVVYDVASDAPLPPGDVSPAFDAASPDAAIDLPLPEDVAPTPCSMLAEAYAAAVRAAQTCATSIDCGAAVCETLCCNCEVFVAPDRARLLSDLRAGADRLSCATTLRCPATRCPAARMAVCSSEGRCVTLRDPTPDAGRDR